MKEIETILRDEIIAKFSCEDDAVNIEFLNGKNLS